MIRATCRLLPALALAGTLWGGLFFGLALPAAAQTGSAEAPSRLPSWVVPALRLVSSTHVEPTTGVVLSDTGRVLVPLAFGDEGDEILVLDGGTDIVRNGRPARLERAFPELGLKVLSVAGLHRQGAALSAEPLTAGSTVTLAAFPPAERIEEGAPPLLESVTLRAAPEGDGLAAEPALPNVTGALLDNCGRLAGYSVADGVQTVAPAAGTHYRWQADLQAVLDQLGLASAGLPCVASDALETEAAQATPAPALDADEGRAPGADDPDVEPPPEPAPPTAQPDSEPPPEVLPPIESEAPPPAVRSPGRAPDAGFPAAGWLGAALLLILAGLALHRLRTRSAAARAPTPAESPAGDDASASQASAGEHGVAGGEEAPQDGRLVLRGQYADGRALRAAAPVNSRAINLEIGRGNADLALDSGAVSRRHARFGGSADALTLADLGSSNGSSINGVPCLEGEVMYVESGDTVILGDVRFVVAFEPAPEPGDDAGAAP